MNNPNQEAFTALNQLVEWSRARELPPGDWIKPLQGVLKDSGSFDRMTEGFPFPFGVFDRDGKLERASDKLLEGTAYTEGDIKAGRGYLYGVESVEFRNAVKLALRGETNVVNGLHKPLENIGTGYADENPNNVSAILFPVIEDNAAILRGAVLFLPFEL